MPSDASPDSFPLSSVRTIVLVGLMGVGKSTVGRRLAARLGLPFADGDHVIEEAAGMTVSEIFATRGEVEFRAGEARVMKRLLEGPPIVLATGGGAVLNPDTRALMEKVSLTVHPDLDRQFPGQRAAQVTIRLHSGQTLRFLQPTRKGDPDMPLTDADLQSKLEELATATLGAERLLAISSRLWQLETAPDLQFL